MQAPQTDARTALLKAAGIDHAPVSLTTRLARAFLRQRPERIPRAHVAALPGQPIDPRAFEDTEEGSGAFGRWQLDGNGLPSYRYEMNQLRDLRAYYVNSEGRNRRDHWHQIGNDVITAMASNDGTVQVFIADRGGMFLNWRQADPDDKPTTLIGYVSLLLRVIIQLINRVRAWWDRYRMRNTIVPRVVALPTAVSNGGERDEPESFTTDLTFAGGFGYLNDKSETWATAFRYGPTEAETRRVFGLGYFETEMTYRGIRQTRRVYAPCTPDSSSDAVQSGRDDPTLLVDVELTNERSAAVDLRYYEYWDVNVHQLQIEWLRTGLAVPFGDNLRCRINQCFDPQMTLVSNPQALRFHQSYNGRPLDGVDRREVDTEPADVFLANLNADTSAYYVLKDTFFGRGSASRPDAVHHQAAADNAIPSPTPGDPMPYCMVLRHDIHLDPGETARLRFAYGAVRPNASLDFLNKYRQGNPLTETQQTWKDRLPYFSTGNDPVLQRETTWHAYNLLSATLYSEYFSAHYTPQGSAYLFLHGAEGVPRDQSLFTIPLVYVRPALARQTLQLLMSLRDADTLALPYGFVGNGAIVRDALGFHAFPWDLDLFFLLAMSEYLAATGDMGFLDTHIPLYRFDRTPGTGEAITVLDHIRIAFKHLNEIVGRGPHGLLRIGDGDWDDAVVITNVIDPREYFKNGGIAALQPTLEHGESVPNSQMALHVLPLAAAVIDAYAPDLATHMRQLASELKEAVKTQWDAGQHWFYRAHLRSVTNEEILIGDHHVSLQSQIWPIISGLSTEMNIEPQLIETIQKNLDDLSATGPMLEVNGQIWPAISQLLTWAYQRSRPDLAWRSLNRQTFAMHAAFFPNIWFNIWSGPDGINSQGMPNAGGTWASPVTPMTDFPLMNANQDAMALLALLRVCGIEPSMSGDGLDIAPKAPPERFVLDTRLLKLTVEPGLISGEYRPVVAGRRTLHVHLPTDTPANVTASIDGKTLYGVPSGAAEVDLPLMIGQGESVAFEVRWNE
jgi:hypothetical protein